MMMKNYDESVKINHNSNCPYIPDFPCRGDWWLRIRQNYCAT